MERQITSMVEIDPVAVKAKALAIASRDKCDIFLYNGDIVRSSDLDFVLAVNSNRKYETCRLILITNGGDPDAAFKMARYLQDRYKKFELLVSGLCKSAGTLIASGAHGLVFSPYGELGPLDVQIFKEDKLSGMHSGLNISEALAAMEKTSLNTFLRLITTMFKSSGGVVSFATASKAAAEMISAMYGPVFAQFDPEDVGSRTRSMRIAADYGKRLDGYAKNMKPDAIRKLSETYSSHSFVIDRMEASALFKNVREADPLELELVGALGNCSRWPVTTPKSEPIIDCLSAPEKEANNANRAKTTGAGPNGAHRASPRGTGGTPDPKPRRPRPGNGRRPNAGTDGPPPPKGGGRSAP